MELRKHRSGLQLYILVFIYIVLYSYNLDKYPRIWWDEALFSNPAYTLLTRGKFGTELLYGWNNIHNNTFWMPPAYLLLLFPSFKLFGFGILQARAISVLLGLVTLIFTYKLAERLYGKNVALFSSILWIFNPINFWIYREVRMEAALIAFLLIAVYSLVTAFSNNSRKYYFLVGIFASLGLLSHPNGLHGIIAIFLILVVKKIYDSRLWVFVLGVLLPGMVYLVYVLLDFNSFIAQFSANIGNSATMIPQNIANEYLRYRGFIGIYGQGFFENDILFYAKLIFFMILSGMLIIYAVRRRTESDKLMIVLIFTYLVMFTILVNQKIWWYLGIILPYLSILMASFLVEKNSMLRIFKIVVAVFFLMNIVHISFSLYTTRDYNYYGTISQIKEIIPEGSTVIGPSELWIGMPEYRFYDYVVIPMRMKDEKFSGILENLAPDYIIIDNNLKSSTYMDDFKKELFDFLNTSSYEVSSISYRSSLSSETPLEIYRIDLTK